MLPSRGIPQLIVRNPFKLEPVGDPVYLFDGSQDIWSEQILEMSLNCNRSWHAATSTTFSGCKDLVVVNGGLVWNKQKDCWQGLPLVFKEQGGKIEAELLTLIVNETLCLIIFKDQIIIIGGMSAPDAFSQPEHSHDIFVSR